MIWCIGFSYAILRLIMHSLCCARLSILWNWEKLDKFSPTKGLRQGDSLSPYLFALCMVVLAQDIHIAVGDGRWWPIQLNRGGPKLSHLSCGNDMILFGGATSGQAHIMEKVLQRFCAMFAKRLVWGSERW